MSFLKEDCGGSLKKRWNLVLEKQSKETLLLVSRWTHALVGALESSHPLGGMLAMTSPIPSWVLHCRGSIETALLGLETGEADFPLGSKGHPSRAINQYALSPFSPPRDSTTIEEHAACKG
jgi:hypothetical protein